MLELAMLANKGRGEMAYCVPRRTWLGVFITGSNNAAKARIP